MSVGELETLVCMVGGRHEWSRTTRPGRKPASCDIHRTAIDETAAPAEREWASDEARRLHQLDALLQTKGISLSELEEATIKKVKSWQTFHKDQAGEAVVTDLIGIEFSPAWESGPAWPVVQPGPTFKSVTPRAARAPSKDGWETALILPDIQIGFWRDPDTQDLIPTHDEAALSVARAVLRDLKPDRVVMNGDNADLPEFSRYRKTPTFALTTQATINRCTEFGAEIRSDAPQADIEWLAGNHEERFPNFIIDNAAAAYGLRRGRPVPEDWPVLSIPYLCRFDETDIKFVPGYPANEVWLNDNFRIVHGDKVTSNGMTAKKYLDNERVSTNYGHIHRREHMEKTRHTRYGPRTIGAYSFGCLCRIDGAVPSTKGGYDLMGRPLVRAEDWQQGFGIIHYEPKGQMRFVVESIPIWGGWTRYNGKEYTSA